MKSVGESTMSQDLTTVSNFNLEQYLGTWYEIARLPMKYQPEDSTEELWDRQWVKIDVEIPNLAYVDGYQPASQDNEIQPSSIGSLASND